MKFQVYLCYDNSSSIRLKYLLNFQAQLLVRKLRKIILKKIILTNLPTFYRHYRYILS